jgi:hypothetical protein
MHNTTPLKNKTNKITVVIDGKPLWKAARGHQSYRGGAGAMGDRRTKRQRTRSAQKRVAIGEH